MSAPTLRKRPRSVRKRNELDVRQTGLHARFRRWGHDALLAPLVALVDSHWRMHPDAYTRRPAEMLRVAAGILAMVALMPSLDPCISTKTFALELEAKERTVKRATKWLGKHGLLLRPVRGTKETGPSIWRLPFLLADRLTARISATMRGRRRAAHDDHRQSQRATKALVVSAPPPFRRSDKPVAADGRPPGTAGPDIPDTGPGSEHCPRSRDHRHEWRTILGDTECRYCTAPRQQMSA